MIKIKNNQFNHFKHFLQLKQLSFNEVFFILLFTTLWLTKTVPLPFVFGILFSLIFFRIDWDNIWWKKRRIARDVEKGKISVEQMKIAMNQVAQVFYERKGIEKMNTGHKRFVNERVQEAIDSMEVNSEAI